GSWWRSWCTSCWPSPSLGWAKPAPVVSDVLSQPRPARATKDERRTREAASSFVFHPSSTQARPRRLEAGAAGPGRRAKGMPKLGVPAPRFRRAERGTKRAKRAGNGPACRLRRLDVDGALAAAAGVLLLIERDPLPLAEVIEGRGAGHAGGVEEDLLAVLGTNKAEAAVTDESND